MAGSYPDVPGYRFALHTDGTMAVTYRVTGGIAHTINNAGMTTLAREHHLARSGELSPSSLTGGENNYLVFIFPEFRSISGYFVSKLLGSSDLMESSIDTTNGQDGTWTTHSDYIAWNGYNLESAPNQRTAINTVNIPNIKAIRFSGRNHFYLVHLYGSIDHSESPDRLRIVDLDGEDIAAQLDFGNIAQRSSVTRQFKVVNNSSTLTANNITVSLSTSSDASPTIIGQYQVSTDNTSFANGINIGSLAPGAESGVLYVRANLLSNAQLGPWSARITAKPVSWS